MKNLSIVILNYNSLGTIKDCLNSFVKYPPKVDYEIIIANNDGNKRDFNSFSKKYPHIKFIQNIDNCGFSSGCNLGASIANGEYLLFLNPDTELNKTTAIDKMLETLENDKNIGICGCRNIIPTGIFPEELLLSPWFLIGYIDKVYRRVNKKQLLDRFDTRKEIWYTDWVVGSAILINHNVFKSINGFADDRYWMYYEELDLCHRVAQLGKKIALLRNVSINHIDGGTTNSNIKTNRITRLEGVISAHNYIYCLTSGYKRFFLMGIYILRTIVVGVLKTTFTLPIFWKKSFKINSYILFGIFKYYILAIVNRSWKSQRLCKK